MNPTVLVVSKAESSSTVDAGNGMSGFRVDLEIIESSGISPKVFIMHREVLSSASVEVYEDQFYSIASVAQLESVPEVPTTSLPFYRVSAVSLIFANLEDLRKYTDKILVLINKLRQANDLANNMLDSAMIGFPSSSIQRFWGFSANTSITDEELLAGSSDALYSKELSKVVENAGAARYLYFAFREQLGEIASIHVNGVLAPHVLETRAVAVLDGFSSSYNIYRTSSTISPSSSILLEIE